MLWNAILVVRMKYTLDDVRIVAVRPYSSLVEIRRQDIFGPKGVGLCTSIITFLTGARSRDGFESYQPLEGTPPSIVAICDRW